MKRLSAPLKRAVTPTSILAVFALVASTGPATGETPPEPTKAHAEDYERILTRLEARGFTGVIAISPNGGETFVAGVGDTASPSGKPDENTLVDSGSITKTVTATAALKLVDEGKLSTSDRLGKYFPAAPAEKAAITVHQLLTHSSGFPGAVGDDLEGLSKEDFIARAMAADLLFSPGSAYEYSNVGYSLIAAIIESISGETYEEYIRNEVLPGTGIATLGYESVYVRERSLLTEKSEDIATASWGGASHWALIGNGGLVTTAADMVRFRHAVKNGSLISNAAINLAQTPFIREGDGAPSHYGYGMVVEDNPKFGRIYWHNGGNEHFLANWTDYADHGLVVFTASNSKAFDADLAGLVIAEEMLGIKFFRIASDIQ